MGTPVGELFSEILRMEFEQFAFEGAAGRRGGVIGEVLGNGEGGHSEDAALFHQTHGFIAQLKGVIDGSDAGASRVEGPRFSGGVYGDALAGTGGFFDGGIELFKRVLVGRDEAAIDDSVFSSFVDLSKVGAFFKLLAHDFHYLSRIVGVSGIG